MYFVNRAWWLAIILGMIVLSACATTEASGNAATVTPTPEVVSFATVAPATATPLPPTNTPLPTPKPQPTATPAPTVAPTPTDIIRTENENPLTGLPVDPQVFTRQPLHVRIGNDAAARPQIGLLQADVVYEELVEWYVTRFTAVFYGNAPEMVAPIRSARLINTQLTQQYDAALVNSGASDPVRWQLSQLPIINLDEYFVPQPYFYREGETAWQRRLAVNLVKAHDYLEKEDLLHSVQLRGFAFADEPPKNAAPAETIFIDYPAKANKVLWQFNAETGLYERFNAGELQIDGATDAPIAVPNVIVYFAKHYETDIVEDSTGATSVGIDVNGEGEAWVFRDGMMVKGRWQTDGTQTPQFFTAEGTLIPLKRGQTWIEVVPTDYDILVNELPADE